MQLLTGIIHVAIMTEDLDRFIAFYTDVLEASVVFEETNPQFRHAILAVGGGSVLHPVQMAGNAHGRASSAMTARGHLDHLALDVPSRAAFDEVRDRLVAHGASDGAVTDLGPKLSFWFVDPDGMHIEVDWVRDPSLRASMRRGRWARQQRTEALRSRRVAPRRSTGSGTSDTVSVRAGAGRR